MSDFNLAISGNKVCIRFLALEMLEPFFGLNLAISGIRSY